jgi:ankyrin repeat protein
VDALGGDLVATPMQSAARNGYLYIIHLLIAHNADPTICDSQGYNTLHLVTHSSSIMPLSYLLHQPVNVDSQDSQGHMLLMWVAYQGDALSMELLLKHGANPNTKDDAGLTLLHWAVVRENKVCIRRLIEKGAEVGAKDGEGRTPKDMAVELKSVREESQASMYLTESRNVSGLRQLNCGSPIPTLSESVSYIHLAHPHVTLAATTAPSRWTRPPKRSPKCSLT